MSLVFLVCFIQWKDGKTYCQFVASANLTACFDGVDLPLCFEDTAILYGISFVFLVLAGFSFLLGSDRKDRSPLPCSLLYASKLVGAQSFVDLL